MSDQQKEDSLQKIQPQENSPQRRKDPPLLNYIKKNGGEWILSHPLIKEERILSIFENRDFSINEEDSLLSKRMWREISKRKSFSSPFLKKAKDKINFSILSLYVTLSLNFIEEWGEYLDWRCVGKNKSVTPEIVEKYYFKFKKGDIYSPFLPKDFVLKSDNF